MAIVNLNYLPIKAHYFLFNGALSGVIPYLPVFAIHLGLSNTAVGLIYSILPFLAVIAKPLFGYLADKLRILKIILILFIIVITLATLNMNFITYYSSPLTSSNLSIGIHCTNLSIDARFSSEPSAICMSDISTDFVPQCNLDCAECFSTDVKGNFSGKNFVEWQSCQMNSSSNIKIIGYLERQNVSMSPGLWKFNVTNYSLSHRTMDLNCTSNIYFLCNASCDPKLNHCFITKVKSEYTNAQFWIFFILIIAIWVPTGISTSLADAACFNILADRAHLYGRQRLWGTIGWGLFVALTGYLNEAVSSDSSPNYSPGFYILISLMLLDLVAISFVKMEDVKVSTNPVKDVRSLLVLPKVLEFIAAVFMIGAFTGLFWSYLYIYIQMLNPSKTHLLLGLISAVQCFLGELPFFFFAAWIIKKLGHAQTLTMTFLAFGLRFILYSYLNDPWWVLPIELLQGPTFGAFYSAMTSYANVAAPPGTEATMQGLVGAAFEGLGLAVGSLLGGISFDFYNGSFTFFWAGIISFVASILHLVFLRIMNSRDKIDKRNHQEQDRGSPGEKISFL